MKKETKKFLELYDRYKATQICEVILALGVDPKTGEGSFPETFVNLADGVAQFLEHMAESEKGGRTKTCLEMVEAFYQSMIIFATMYDELNKEGKNDG